MNFGGTTPTLGEMGLERLQPAEDQALPLGGGLWTMPHYMTFVAFMNFMTRSYWWTFDEALRDSTCNSDAMRNDIVVRDALSTVYMSVVLNEWHLEPIDKSNQLLVASANKLTNVIQEIPYLQQFMRCLMEATFFGKYGVQPLFKWDRSLGYRRMLIKRWYPVHGDKIVFKWDGTPGILVNASYKSKQVEYTERGPAYFLNAEEEENFIWHEFEQEDSTYFQPQFAGTIHGSGYRGRIYWYWWLRQNAQRFMMNFLKKAGNGYLLVGYPSGNVAAKSAAKTAVEGQEGNNIIYVPINIREGESIDKVVTHVPMSMNGSQMMWTIITGINEIIRNAIVKETLTSRTGATGLGSNVAEQHGATSDDRDKYYCNDLETPMQKVTVLLNKRNCPGLPPPKFKFLVDKRNPLEVITAVDKALDWGMPVPQSWPQDELGIPTPINNEPVLAKIQPMQPTAVGNVPSGTPMAGPSGPAGAISPQNEGQQALTPPPGTVQQ